jgi:uncharacterized protein (TIGR02266 family)
MIQETRKDPRAKVLSMTVRYKSATIDEFIEHHSHDVSRGGMYIKTPSPFPAGTLLKFEVRIADEKKVMQGVGRVVWKRDASAASPDSPAGMGVKFIKLDEESKAVIDRLIGTRGDKDGAYDVGERASQSGAGPAPEAPRGIRKGTMIGLGAMKPADVPRRSSTPPPPSEGDAPAHEGFFPSGPPMEQPPPEDRTMMKQAAELLRDALREAGGSMDEIGSTGVAPVIASPNEHADDSKHVSAPPKARTSEPTTAAATRSEPPGTVARAKSVAPPAPAAKPASVPPRKVERPLPSSVPAPALKSGPKPALMLLAVAAIGGGLFWLNQQNKPAEPPAPSVQAEPAAVAPPTPEPIASEAPAVASAEPSAAPSASAAPEETKDEKAARLKAEAATKKAEDDAAKKAADDAKKAEAAAKKAEDTAAKKAADDAKKAELDTKRAAALAAAAAAPRPAPAPAPAKPKAKPAPSATGETPPEEKPPAGETKPAEKPPAAETKPAEKPPAGEKPAAPAPAPVPGPKAPESDNPY